MIKFSFKKCGGNKKWSVEMLQKQLRRRGKYVFSGCRDRQAMHTKAPPPYLIRFPSTSLLPCTLPIDPLQLSLTVPTDLCVHCLLIVTPRKTHTFLFYVAALFAFALPSVVDQPMKRLLIHSG